MTLPLNPEMVAHLYDYLSECPPFNKWSLPPSEEIKFKIIKNKKIFGRYYTIGGVHHIDISSGCVGSHMILLSTVAHEKLHLHLNEIDSCDNHGPKFQMLADEICKINSFDRLTF